MRFETSYSSSTPQSLRLYHQSIRQRELSWRPPSHALFSQNLHAGPSPNYAKAHQMMNGSTFIWTVPFSPAIQSCSEVLGHDMHDTQTALVSLSQTAHDVREALFNRRVACDRKKVVPAIELGIPTVLVASCLSHFPNLTALESDFRSLLRTVERAMPFISGRVPYVQCVTGSGRSIQKSPKRKGNFELFALSQ